MLSSIRNFFSRLTNTQIEGLAKAALTLGVVLGVCLVFAGNLLAQPPLGTALSTIGVTILGSGIFAAVLKYFQFIGIFRKEFDELLRSASFRSLLLEAHFSMAAKGTDVYEHVAARKITEFYPDLRVAFDRSKGDYGDGQFDYYLANFERSITLKSFDPGTGVIEIEDETDVDIVAPSTDRIKYSFFVAPDARAGADSFKMLYLKIDGQDRLNDAALKNGQIDVAQVLQGKRRYRVTRRAVQRYRLRFDPIKTHHFNRLTLEPSIRVRNEIPKQIEYELVPWNSLRRWAREAVPTNDSRVVETRHTFPDIMFPHQGYYVTFNEVIDARAPTTARTSESPATQSEVR